MVKVFDEDNNPLEGFLSPEDVDAKIEKAAEEAAIKATEALDVKISEVQTKFDKEMKLKDKKIQELKDDLDSDLSDEDKNWKKTREKIEQLEKDKVEMEATFGKKLDEISGKISDSKIDTRINNLAKGDKELKDKISVHYNSFEGEPKNEKEIQERLKNAVILAGGDASDVNVLNGGAIRTGAGVIPGETKSTEKLDNPESKDVGNKIGLSDKELKDGKLI